MKTAEVNKIALIIFHVIALMLLFTSVSLLLDKTFTQGSNAKIIKGTFEFKLSIITIFIAATSWFILVKKWIQERGLAYYLKSILFTKTILIIGLILLLLI
ncbi:hypothetical protein [Aequorivita flava]|uniref:Uncharacterized protein n=1 Tax=Aequorivita flava TaxID=3114371 RepID=A0AB35YQA2_9FLAO